MNHRAHILALALGGVLALADRSNPTRFRRAPEGEWVSWFADMNPPPPTAADIPTLEACGHGHGSCVDWHGVHFNAIRFPDDRTWEAGKGWWPK